MVLFMCTGCEVIHWDGKPTSDHILGEKSLCPPPAAISCQWLLSWGLGLGSPSVSMLECLTDLIFYRSSVGTLNYCEFM